MTGTNGRHIGFFMYGLTGGGVARRIATLINALAERGDRVELLLARGGNPGGIEIDDQVTVLPLDGWRSRLPWVRGKRLREFAGVRGALAAYMRQSRPDVMIAADTFANLTALEARLQSGQSLPLIIGQRTHLSAFLDERFEGRDREAMMARILRLYPLADAIVGVSKGVSSDLVRMGVPEDGITTIYSSIIGPDTPTLAAAPIEHPWFQEGQPPVILSIGRITAAKDFPTLLRAFARLVDSGRDLRLVILGAAKSEKKNDRLLDLASTLGIRDRLDLPSAVVNPFRFIARSALLACSSKREGLPATLVEALACGTPVVSTDCPSGPAEILTDETIGRLVPVGDHQAMADAMAATLDNPPDAADLMRSAERFANQTSVDAYSALIDELRLKLAA
ncbi:MAG: glycosyltransferase [Pseudomonadota bacterium]